MSTLLVSRADLSPRSSFVVGCSPQITSNYSRTGQLWRHTTGVVLLTTDILRCLSRSMCCIAFTLRREDSIPHLVNLFVSIGACLYICLSVYLPRCHSPVSLYPRRYAYVCGVFMCTLLTSIIILMEAWRLLVNLNHKTFQVYAMLTRMTSITMSP